MTSTHQRASFGMRFLYATPILGQIARDVQKDISSIYYALVILVTCIVLAMKLWGLVALAMTALAFVPVVFFILLAITRG